MYLDSWCIYGLKSFLPIQQEKKEIKIVSKKNKKTIIDFEILTCANKSPHVKGPT